MPIYPNESKSKKELKSRSKKTSRTGFEPVISALRGQRPGPLDERDLILYFILPNLQHPDKQHLHIVRDKRLYSCNSAAKLYPSD